MEPVPLWGIIFINCITLLISIWILIRLYKNRSDRSVSFYIYGIASLIGLFLGVISFFYHICHALCAIIIGIYLFIDTFKYKKTISKLSYASYPSVIKRIWWWYCFNVLCYNDNFIVLQHNMTFIIR